MSPAAIATIIDTVAWVVHRLPPDQRLRLEAQFSLQAVATALLVALACMLVRSFDRGSPASARRRDSRSTAAGDPEGVC